MALLSEPNTQVHRLEASALKLVQALAADVSAFAEEFLLFEFSQMLVN